MPAIWTHEQADPQANTEQVLSVCEARSWPSLTGPDLARVFRSYLCLSLGLAHRVGSRPVPTATEGPAEVAYALPGFAGSTQSSTPLQFGDFRASDFPLANTGRIAGTLLRSVMLCLPRPAKGESYEVHSFETRDGGATAATKAGTEVVETGALPVIVLVVGVVAAAAVACFVAERVTDVVDANFRRSDALKALAENQAAAFRVISAHLELEARTGQKLEWTPAEMQIVGQVEAAQKTVAELAGRPLPQPFPGSGRFWEEAGKGVETGLSWGIPIAAALGGYLLVSQKG